MLQHDKIICKGYAQKIKSIESKFLIKMKTVEKSIKTRLEVM